MSELDSRYIIITGRSLTVLNDDQRETFDSILTTLNIEEIPDIDVGGDLKVSDDKYNKLIAIIESHKSCAESVKKVVPDSSFSSHLEGRIQALDDILNEARIEIDGDES